MFISSDFPQISFELIDTLVDLLLILPLLLFPEFLLAEGLSLLKLLLHVLPALLDLLVL